MQFDFIVRWIMDQELNAWKWPLLQTMQFADDGFDNDHQWNSDACEVDWKSN